MLSYRQSSFRKGSWSVSCAKRRESSKKSSFSVYTITFFLYNNWKIRICILWINKYLRKRNAREDSCCLYGKKFCVYALYLYAQTHLLSSHWSIKGQTVEFKFWPLTRVLSCLPPSCALILFHLWICDLW